MASWVKERWDATYVWMHAPQNDFKEFWRCLIVTVALTIPALGLGIGGALLVDNNPVVFWVVVAVVVVVTAAIITIWAVQPENGEAD